MLLVPVMPNGDSLDGFFYPTLTLVIDSYSMGRIHSYKKVNIGTHMFFHAPTFAGPEDAV